MIGLLVLAAALATTPDGNDLDIRVNPARVCAAARSPAYFNVDFLIRNKGREDARIVELRASAENSRGQAVERRLVWQAAVGLLNNGGVIPAGQQAIIFNPLSFSTARDIKRVRFEFDLAGRDTPLSVVVTPVDCAPAKALLAPVAGHLLVYDGHDFWSHHRRGEYLDEWSQTMKIDDNFQRFGVDLVVVDAAGKPYHGGGKSTRDWYGWGRPVRAMGDGMIAAMHDGQPDNVVIGTVDKWTARTSVKNPMSSYGNYVLIDHGGGEFSLVGHLRQGSIVVKPGDKVRAGQRIGAIGNSGASGGVHVHVERRTGDGLAGIATLPAFFRDVRLANGGTSAPTRGLVLDTGDIVDAR